MAEETALAPIGPRSVALHTLDELLRFSAMVANSPFAPREFKTPESVAVAIQYGMEVGLTPLAALQNIALINGRPSLFGDAMLAVVIASGKLEDWQEAAPEEITKTGVGRCVMKRRGYPHAVTRTFSRDEARKAGLLSKPGPWKEYESRMLQMRARGFTIRDLFADVLKGLIAVEEAWDYPAPPLQVGSGATNGPGPSPDEEEGKKLLLKTIRTDLLARVPGKTKEDDAKLRSLMLETFGASPWKNVQALPLAELQAGYAKLQPPEPDEPALADDEEDVPDHPPPSSTAPSASAGAEVVTAEQFTALKVYAQRHGLSEDFEEILSHYPNGFTRDAYETTKRNLEHVVSQRAAQAQPQQALEV